MIDPERSKYLLDLQDGGTPLKLWFCNGATRTIEKKLGLDISFSDIQTLASHLTPSTLALFIWAGRLWEDRSLELDKIEMRVDWGTPRDTLSIVNEVSGALLIGLLGEIARKKEDPKQPTAVTNGIGTTSSPSLSAS